jgi:cardiolipin synthase C
MSRKRWWLGGGITVVALIFLAWPDLPSLAGRTESQALARDPGSPIVRTYTEAADRHPGLTGIHALSDGQSAFAARMLMIESAHQSLDIQYYIWHDDVTGHLLFDALRRADARGVRVRLLLDDNGISGLDPVLAAMDALPNTEVRLYNPFLQRRFKALGYMTDFRRLNRRMHNKSLTADGAASIIGGRNIGNEYFNAADGVNFADLDLLAVGNVVPEVAAMFDRYWNSQSAYPLSLLIEPNALDARQHILQKLDAHGGQDAIQKYASTLKNSSFVIRLSSRNFALEWVPVKLLADAPEKTLARGEDRAQTLMLPRLGNAIGKAENRLDLVSPYFVPMSAGTEAFADLARKDVQIRVLTNSLAATDVSAVHAGYAKRREALLRAGIRLFELKPEASQADSVAPNRALGSSSASLHAKTFAVDGRRAFVGSFNFDPRSAAFNTEMGFVVDSPSLATAIHTAFDTELHQNSYEVRLGASGNMEWIDGSSGNDITWHEEPGTGLLKRGLVTVLSWLPIDIML